jgi:hypothetical protein
VGSITGKFYQPLIDSFQTISEDKSDDNFVASVYTGSVKGLFRFYGGIVVKGELGQLWAAYTDQDIVRYFTTEPEFKQKLPITIARWVKELDNKKVEYASEVNSIPETWW